ncbi:jmjC domain-containing protein 8 isoform X5 [Elephas maximus indicus]|uniref:jmjC domain-containing protein 8 isoform X5 n=1 Tax=Elephas maximus indicus TaxID=99487 RepID=UPI002115F066|nr:jmjC domain-containing protein 8 isoform X5 [Elephas maximus indicus]XP_049760021.1 jmjC domain-containing protein 8 isoform X5 [Elephas maximus indicus]XP_049760022.1 jmjC domain-containing protein 8 isoform X5 [Elephas maximus indicus]
MSRLPVARTRRGAAPSPRVPALVGGGLPGGGGGSGDGGRVAVVTGGANHDSVRPALCLPGRWADLSNSFREPRGAHLLPGRRISQPLWAARSAAGLPGVPRGGGRDAGGVDTVVAPGVRQLLLLDPSSCRGSQTTRSLPYLQRFRDLCSRERLLALFRDSVLWLSAANTFNKKVALPFQEYVEQLLHS